jgi:hypothetical protein
LSKSCIIPIESHICWVLVYDHQFGVRLSHKITPLSPVENFPTVIGLLTPCAATPPTSLPPRYGPLWLRDDCHRHAAVPVYYYGSGLMAVRTAAILNAV